MSDDLKRSSKCEINSSKPNFFKGISTKDGLNQFAKFVVEVII